MTLKEIYQERFASNCDKGTVHNYIEGYYEAALAPYRELPVRLLELGVWQGGSLELWHNYFSHAQIIGVDIVDRKYRSQHANVKFVRTDGYTQAFLDTLPDESFDLIIDDGPHTLKSQVWAIEHYPGKLKPGGKLIIEDIQSEKDLQFLCHIAQTHSLPHRVIDLRKDKGRYDDLILEITK